MYRREIEIKGAGLGRYDLEGSIDTVISKLQTLKAEHGEGLKIDISTHEDYGSITINVQVYRPETDAEMTIRAEKESAEARLKVESQLKAERTQYNRLKAKFESIK